jgi:hypothetical protein
MKRYHLGKRSEIPVEERSYGWIFFLCSSLLLLSTVWAIVDETWVRRPWKKYQSQFIQLEYNKVNAEFTEAKSRFNEEKSPIYNRLKEELSLVEDALKDAEYNEAQKTFNHNQQELVKVS